MMKNNTRPRYPHVLVLVTSSFFPSFAYASDTFGAWQLGLGRGQTTISGDHSRTVQTTLLTSGLTLERPGWRFEFSGTSSTKNQMSDLWLIGAVGNATIKVGTGIIGMNSSYPTSPGTVATFYQAATEQDTRVSATTVPLYIRVTPYASPTWHVFVDGYYGLYSKGSLTIPIHTLVPGHDATVSTEPHQTGGVYGARVNVLVRFNKDVGVRVALSQMHGRMDAHTAKIDRDILDIVPPIQTPDVQFVNRSLSVSLVFLTD